ncbi:MAG: hypothetical protein DRN15_09030 [Thermoprotei archaeon]|nr:MAG: hypothetical protein DRN15_09030 [Thermoprotei archaeon]
MKEIFELAGTISTSDITALTPKVMSATVEEIRRGKRVFAQFYKVNRDLVGTGGTQVEFPKKSSNVVVQTNMSAGAAITAEKISYDAVTISIKKHGVGLAFQGEALRQVKRDVIADAIKEAGEAYADAMDTLALEAMFPTVTIVGSSSIGAAAGTIIIGVKSTIGNVSNIVQDANGCTVNFGAATGTIVAWYIPTTAGARRVSAAAGSLSAKDILMARSDIISKNFEPDVVIIHPKRLAEIIYDPATKFVEAWAYRGAGPLMNGEIGQMWGLKVIVTNKAPIYGAILVDSDDLGYCVERMDLELKRDEYTGINKDILYFWGFAERNYGVVNPEAYGAVALQGTFSPVEVNPTR